MPSPDHAYYAALSGLTPASKFSAADHKWAFIQAQAAGLKPTLTVSNLNRQQGR